MKNRSENLAIGVVSVLSLAIMYFIAQYNMIGENNAIDEIESIIAKKVTVEKKEGSLNHLNNMKKYSEKNIIKEDTPQSSYMQNFKNYIVQDENQKSSIDEVEKAIDEVLNNI